MNIWKATMSALIWSICYLYIRRYLNPEIDDYTKYSTDAMYGGISTFVATLLKDMLI